MRHVSPSLALILLLFLYAPHAGAQMNVFSANLSLGSSGTQVVALQKILNRAVGTRIASVGPGSPGNETGYFGALTKAAVVRFQEKYAGEILAPAKLAHGNGYVGSYTRARLSALAAAAPAEAGAAGANPSPIAQSVPAPMATSTSDAASSITNYLIRDSEKINIYAGDAMLENVRNKIYAAINTAVAAQSVTTITPPTITPAEVPSVVIGALSPQSGTPGMRVSMQGDGISANSVVYFGNAYIVRAVSRDILGNFSFIIPPIPPARYDVAVRTGDTVSNTATFVITDARNPSVHIQNVSPSIIPYGGTLTIAGSGFLFQGNVVVTTYQKFTNISSPDGRTLTIQPAPVSLRESAKIGDGTRNMPMSLYVVNDYGFSDSAKSFTMSI